MYEGGREPRESGRQVWQGAVGLFLLGAALGLAFNALQLSAGSRRGLAWIARPVRLATLQAVDSVVSADALDSLRAVTDPGTPSPDSARAAAPPAGTGPAAASRAAAERAATGRTPAARAPAAAAKVPAQAPPAPAPAAPPGEAPARPQAALPAVPDTKEPLDIDYDAARRFWSAGAALFVDARSREEYAEGHIPGAVNLDFDDVQRRPELAGKLDTLGRPILVTYCSGGSCELSHHLAIALIEAGHRKVLVFTGGMPVWQSSGGPVTTGPDRGQAP